MSKATFFCSVFLHLNEHPSFLSELETPLILISRNVRHLYFADYKWRIEGLWGMFRLQKPPLLLLLVTHLGNDLNQRRAYRSNPIGMPSQTVDEKRSCHRFCRGMNAFLYEREEILKKERKRRKKQGCRRGSPLPFG